MVTHRREVGRLSSVQNRECRARKCQFTRTKCIACVIVDCLLTCQNHWIEWRIESEDHQRINDSCTRVALREGKGSGSITGAGARNANSESRRLAGEQRCIRAHRFLNNWVIPLPLDSVSAINTATITANGVRRLRVGDWLSRKEATDHISIVVKLHHMCGRIKPYA
jgi:hypothetical protein